MSYLLFLTCLFVFSYLLLCCLDGLFLTFSNRWLICTVAMYTGISQRSIIQVLGPNTAKIGEEDHTKPTESPRFTAALSSKCSIYQNITSLMWLADWFAWKSIIIWYTSIPPYLSIWLSFLNIAAYHSHLHSSHHFNSSDHRTNRPKTPSAPVGHQFCH